MERLNLLVPLGLFTLLIRNLFAEECDCFSCLDLTVFCNLVYLRDVVFINCLNAGLSCKRDIQLNGTLKGEMKQYNTIPDQFSGLLISMFNICIENSHVSVQLCDCTYRCIH